MTHDIIFFCIFAKNKKEHNMRFIVSSKLLLKNLEVTSSVVASINNVPATGYVKFEINNNRLTLTGTDLETTITTSLDLSESDGNGIFLVSPKMIMDPLKKMADIPVAFNIDTENNTIQFTGDDKKYNTPLYADEVSEFPEFPEINPLGSFEIDSKILLTGITKTAFATGSADFRPILGSIFCEIQPEHISFVATDAHRLVRYRHTGVKSEISHALTLPKKPLMVLKDKLSTLEGNVTVSYNETKVCFSIDKLMIISRLVEGKYPNYEAVIPKHNNNILRVDRQKLYSDINSVASYANQSTHQIRLKIAANNLSITAEDVEMSNKAESNMACTFENIDGDENFEIGFSAKFLAEILSYLDSEEVWFKLSNKDSAGLIFPAKENSDEEETLMLLMPIMLN